MYLKCGDMLMILVGILHNKYSYWEGISKLQKNGLEKVIIDDHIFLQIRLSVIKSVKRDVYLNGTIDNEEIDYHVLGAGGAALLITFDECDTSTLI